MDQNQALEKCVVDNKKITRFPVFFCWHLAIFLQM